MRSPPCDPMHPEDSGDYATAQAHGLSDLEYEHLLRLIHRERNALWDMHQQLQERDRIDGEHNQEAILACENERYLLSKIAEKLTRQRTRRLLSKQT